MTRMQTGTLVVLSVLVVMIIGIGAWGSYRAGLWSSPVFRACDHCDSEEPIRIYHVSLTGGKSDDIPAQGWEQQGQFLLLYRYIHNDDCKKVLLFAFNVDNVVSFFSTKPG